MIINESYKTNTGYMTLWEAKDFLQYAGTIISLTCTVLLGAITVYVNRRLLELNKRQLLMEETRELPLVDIKEVSEGQAAFEFFWSDTDKCYRCKLWVSNTSSYCISDIIISDINLKVEEIDQKNRKELTFNFNGGFYNKKRALLDKNFLHFETQFIDEENFIKKEGPYNFDIKVTFDITNKYGKIIRENITFCVYGKIGYEKKYSLLAKEIQYEVSNA